MLRDGAAHQTDSWHVHNWVWAKMLCGLTADSNSVHQADSRLPAMRLRSL